MFSKKRVIEIIVIEHGDNMIFVYFLFGVIFLLLAIIFTVDFCTEFLSRLKRYKIGKWCDENEWENAVESRCVKWLNKTPTVKQTDNNRYIIFDILSKKHRNSTIQSWQTAGLLLGATNCNTETSKKAINSLRKKTFTDNGDWKTKINKVDSALLAYALLKCFDSKDIKPAMDYTIKIIEDNLCDDGMISYSQGKNSVVRFVDTLGMVCPFLALYGEKYNESKYVELAMSQVLKFREKGILSNTQLPCHAFNVSNGLPLGIYGWGRGTAWYFIALIEMYNSISDENIKSQLKSLIKLAAEDYLKYQNRDGSFNTILQGAGQYDSSVTVAMAYFFQECYFIFRDEKYLNVSKLALNKIRSVTMKNGAVDQCQGDTHGIGIFSQVFDVMPFVQGILLKTIKRNEEVL